jgi:hypothetical protein
MNNILINLHIICHETFGIGVNNTNVITLTLGSQPKQRLAKVWPKNKKVHESHFMLRECRRVQGNKPPHPK